MQVVVQAARAFVVKVVLTPAVAVADLEVQAVRVVMPPPCPIFLLLPRAHKDMEEAQEAEVAEHFISVPLILIMRQEEEVEVAW